MECPKCHQPSLSDTECTSCGIIFSRFDERSLIPPSKLEKKLEQYKEEEKKLVWYAIAFPPLAFLMAPIINFILQPLAWSISMWTHEFGHAFAGWWAGYRATPFLGWTNYGSQNWFTTICVMFLIGAFFYLSLKAKSYFLVVVFGLMFLVQIVVRFFIGEENQRFLMTYMGIGGEIWISTVLILAFHYELPEKLQWKFMRYPMMIIGALVFYQVFEMWLEIGAGKRDIPWGSLWGGADRGDMNTIRLKYGWLPKMITASYLKFCWISFVIIVVHYLFFLGKTIMEWLNQSSSKQRRV